ncbi:hypothetical protein ACTWPT_52140 [Nonomuraea sp. 3N208]|uniref:hypothetical protein n=1 Tax=Nonomuraea sp. 3N208 TaxID=3457421 RepID=UPI003FD08E96
MRCRRLTGSACPGHHYAVDRDRAIADALGEIVGEGLKPKEDEGDDGEAGALVPVG